MKGRAWPDFRALPEYLQVGPGHGAGSACGRALGAVPQSTVGYELWDAASVAASWRELLLIGLEQAALYWTPPVLDAWQARHGALPRRERRTAAELQSFIAPPGTPGHHAVTVVVVRAPEEYATGHIAGCRNIPLGHLAARYRELPPDGPVVVHCGGAPARPSPPAS